MAQQHLDEADEDSVAVDGDDVNCHHTAWLLLEQVIWLRQ
jgi:hypothetical protein